MKITWRGVLFLFALALCISWVQPISGAGERHTNDNFDPGSLRKTSNLNDLDNKATARSELNLANHDQIAVDAAGLATFPDDVAIGARLHIHSGSVHLKALATDTVPEAGGVIIHAITTNGHTRPVFVDDDARQFIIGEDATILVKNTTGSTITKGSAVYISGSSGNLALVSLAKADSLATLPACGFTIADIANNGTGHVIVLGVSQQIDTSAWSSGDEVYVSPTTAGEITNSRPVYPNMVQLVGRVLVSGVGNGSIQIAIAPFVGNQETGTPNSFTVGQNLTVTGQINGASEVASAGATADNLMRDLTLVGSATIAGKARIGGPTVSGELTDDIIHVEGVGVTHETGGWYFRRRNGFVQSSLADNGIATDTYLRLGPNDLAVVRIVDRTENQAAEFWVVGSTSTKISDPAGDFSPTQGNAGTINVYVDQASGYLQVENKETAARAFKAVTEIMDE